MSRIFADSKTFVDMKMKSEPDVIYNAFNDMMSCQITPRSLKHRLPPREVVAKFVSDHFTLADQMEEHLPTDWSANPKIGPES